MSNLKRHKGLAVSMAAAVMAVTVFSACTNGGSGTTSTAPVEQAKNQELGFVKLKMFYPCGDNCPQKDQQLVQDALNKILKEKINAEVELNGIDWSAWSQKMPLNYQTGEQIDIAWIGGGDFYVNVAKQAYLPLNSLLVKHGQGIKKAINPVLLQGPVVKNELYAIPVNKEIASSSALALRKDLVDKHNIDAAKIKHLEDLESVLKTIKDNEPLITPIWIGGNDFLDALTARSEREEQGKITTIPTAPIGLVYNIQSGKVEFKPDKASEMDKLQLLHKWFEQGYINKDAATTKTKPKDQLKANKAWMMGISGKPDSENELAADLKVPFVKVTGPNPPNIDTGAATGSMLAIGRTSKDPERAMMLLNLLYTDKELLNLLVWGIEGKHYTKVKDDIIKLPDGAKNRTETGYNPGIHWEMGNQFLNYLYENENPAKWELFKKYNESGKVHELFGYSFDPANVKAEVAAFNNVFNEFKPILQSGTIEPTDTMKKYKEKAEANGMAKIVAEVQKQIDEWKATKK